MHHHGTHSAATVGRARPQYVCCCPPPPPPAAERDVARLTAEVRVVAGLWRLLDQHLEGRDYMEGGVFTLADLVLGAYARRWFGLDAQIDRPALPNLERWYAQVGERAGFRQYVAAPLS